MTTTVSPKFRTNFHFKTISAYSFLQSSHTPHKVNVSLSPPTHTHTIFNSSTHTKIPSLIRSSSHHSSSKILKNPHTSFFNSSQWIIIIVIITTSSPYRSLCSSLLSTQLLQLLWKTIFGVSKVWRVHFTAQKRNWVHGTSRTPRLRPYASSLVWGVGTTKRTEYSASNYVRWNSQVRFLSLWNTVGVYKLWISQVTASRVRFLMIHVRGYLI